MSFTLIDYAFMYSFISIWFLLLSNVILALGGYLFARKIEMRNIELSNMITYPFVSILIPAHNEEKVIGRTITSLVNLDYPNNKYEIIIINDNSSDKTKEILCEKQKKHNQNSIIVITTTKENGGIGKSNALNIGYTASKGQLIAVYDADNTPEKYALKYLVNEIQINEKYAAVIGKFRTRNKEKNWLTKFINIETLSFQWMIQAGRWQLFNICTIPGTNFIIKKSVIEKTGGWDIHAIAEDTEISFRIFRLGYKIGFMPKSVTWEQEPETIRVWLKQRTRWVKGNIYVLIKYAVKSIKERNIKVIIDLSYFFSVYFLFLSSVLISDIIFILSILTNIKMMWIIVSLKGFFLYITDTILKKKTKWYKTERF